MRSVDTLRSVPIAILALLPVLPAAAGEPPVIRVSGEATLQVEPDRAQIEFGVISEAPSAERAAADSAEKLAATIAALRRVLGSEGRIETRGYSLSPRYRHVPKSGQRELVGYSASNVVAITTDDLDAVGPLIDAATAQGANTIQQLRFTLKDESAVRLRALRRAAEAARAKADAIAAALELEVVRVISVEEGASPGRPVVRARFAQAREGATPIEAASVEVRATVQLVVEVKE